MTKKQPAIRNRIKGHRVVRAGELVPHELNWRRHPAQQRQALRAILEEVGFARSLLAYELPDGRLKLIDGHLRADTDPDALVTVEVLDVSDDEARKLLMTIDPLAMLAEADQSVVSQLHDLAETNNADLQALWDQVAEASRQTEEALKDLEPPVQQVFVLIECENEDQQVELLERFRAEGLKCKALLS